MATSKKLLEPKQALIGFIFMNNLTDLRKAAEMYPELTIGDDFNINKNIVATSRMGRLRYRDLPPDAKSFASRCAALCKQYPEKGYLAIGREQLLVVQTQSEELFKSYIDMVDQHIQRTLDKKRRRNLMLRMCCYGESFFTLCDR